MTAHSPASIGATAFCGHGPKKKKGPGLLLLLLFALFALTGCLGRPSGGSLTRQGMAALERLDYNTALADFQQAILNGEDEVMALRGEGITLLGMGRYEDAAAALTQALVYTDRKMPETIRDIREYLASAQYRGGAYTDAVITCEDLLAEDELPEAYYYLGASYLAMGELNQARENFDKAVALAENDYTLYLQIYEVYESANLTAVGDEYLQTALRLHPSTMEEQYRIGQIYFYLEKYDEARSALMEPVEESYLPALELMGEIYLAQEDYTHALAAFQMIMQEKGESPEVYNGLALCSMASGDYDTALSYIETGLAMEPEEGKQQLRFNEVVVYERKLDFSTALVKAEAYAALYPTDEAGKKELSFLRTR